MLQFSQYAVIASLVLVLLSWVLYVAAFVKSFEKVAEPVSAQAHPRGGTLVAERPPTPSPVAAQLSVWATQMARLALVILLAALTTRGLATGHGPFSNQYEFTVSFATGMVLAYVVSEWKYRIRTIALVVLPWAAAALVYAAFQDAAANRLVPALQNNLLLSLHVIVAIFAYGAFAISFGAAALYLWRDAVTSWLEKTPAEALDSNAVRVRRQVASNLRRLPSNEVLDRLGYKAVIIGFPMLSMVIVLGAVWADIAWGSYWSWDPKETASLVTWLIYGAYLHARSARGWVGKGAAWLLVVGFASVLLTFLGNLFFGGMHSYGRM